MLEQKEVDELDSWFDEEEEEGNQDLSAGEAAQEEQGGSPDDSAAKALPDEEVLDDDATAQAVPSEEGVSEETSGKSDDPQEWIAGLPSEQRDYIETLVRRDQSNAGRVAALRSRLDQAEAEKEARSTATSPPPSTQAGGAGKEVGELSDEELDTFRKEFPSVAANVDKIVAQQLAREREEILGQVRPIQEEQAQRRIVNEKQRLRTEAEKIFNTAETGIHYEDVIASQEWKDWYTNQPAAYQQFINTANTADAAAVALRDFDRYARETFAEDTPAETKTTARADSTAARRKQTLQTDTPPSRSAPLDDKGVGDYESYFNQAVRESGYKV